MFEPSEFIKSLDDAITSDDNGEVHKLTKNINPIDFADILKEFDDKKLIEIFKLIKSNIAAETFVYLGTEVQELLFKNFTPIEMNNIISNLYSDDLVDIINVMPADIVKKILKVASPEKRLELDNILKYDQETAGAMMSVNFIKIKEKFTIEKAIREIRKVYKEFETVDDLFIIDEFETVKGLLEFKELVFNDPKMLLKDIMNKSVITVSIDTDQEQVADIFKKYDINTIPVVDKKNRMVGIITVDDVIDVIETETTEDIAQMAGIKKFEENFFEANIYGMAKSRIVWLAAMLILGTIAQILIIIFFNVYGLNEQLSDHTTKLYYGIMMLSPMVLILAGVAGSSANQTSIMMTRALSLHIVRKKELGKIILKEFLISLIIASILILINMVRLFLVYWAQFKTLQGQHIWSAIGASSLALLVGIIVGNFIGLMLPVLAKVLKIDPSIASSPLITTIIDIIVVAIFFAIGLGLY